MYERKGPHRAALYGREMSPTEAQGIIHEVSGLAEKIDRMLSGDKCPGLPGDKGEGDLSDFWTSLFNRDLKNVLYEIASHHFNREEDAVKAAEEWKYLLHQRTRELLTFGMMADFEFLKRAEKAIPHFSKSTVIHHPDEPQFETRHALRRLSLLNSLFENYPYTASPLQSVFVNVEPHGVVTVLRFRERPNSGEYCFGIGINTANPGWESVGFNFDVNGHVGPLCCVNPLGNVASLKPGFTPPTADSLCRDVITAFLGDPKVRSFDHPKEPNRRWFV